jgi:hypothetical protein
MSSAVAVLSTVLWLFGQNGALLDDYRTASRTEKIRILSDSLLGRRAISDDDVRRLLVAAMRDDDASVRAQAVASVAGILVLSSWTPVPEGAAWTTRRRPLAETLIPEITAATKDADPTVRLEALRGVVGQYSTGPGRAALPLAVVNELARVFDHDASPLVRTFALSAATAMQTSADPEIRAVATDLLLRGLAESDPWIVQAAAQSAAATRMPEALPPLVAQLRHASHIARTAVAESLAAYGAAARPYLTEIQGALDREPDDQTRKALAAAIAIISK